MDNRCGPLVLLLLAGFLLVSLVEPINWLGLSQWERDRFKWTSKTRRHWSKKNGMKSSCWSALRHELLSREQVRMCIKHPQLMSTVWEAAVAATVSCRDAFADRRWNCSSIDTIPRLTPDLTQGSREQAWVHALSSASLTHSIARGCSSGRYKLCGCGSLPRHPPDGQFKWGGCGDDVRYAKKFAKAFTDATYRKMIKRAGTSHASVTVIAATNLHNSKAGRKAVEQSLRIQCKCHGVSGSCNVKTCWRSLPPISEIANRLKRLYGTAVEVVCSSVHGKLRMVAVTLRGYHDQDLIYTKKSPDYCTANGNYGSFGTQGRQCNVTSETHGGCRSMCCGRGYVSTLRHVVERCHCKYYWCCYVRCQTCYRSYDHSTCL